MVGYSQQLVVGPTGTIAWDAVTVSQGVISYEIWLKSDTAEIFVEEIAVIAYTYDISAYENVLNIGVKTKLTIGSEVYMSSTNWSGENGVYTPIPFVLWQAVGKVKNMRIE